jgi:RNA polymerase sigma-70 factor, ECF subfamily
MMNQTTTHESSFRPAPSTVTHPGCISRRAEAPRGKSTESKPRAADVACTEAELVQRLLSGDEQAFVRLVDKHHGSMLRLAQVFVSNRSVAEEVVQETWLAVIRGLVTFQGRSSLKTWLYRILTNRAKSRGVREGRTVPFSALEREDPDGSGQGFEPAQFTWSGSWRSAPRRWDDDTPEKLLIDGQTRGRIEQVIQSLPAKQRAVVTLRDVEGWESDEVCELLDITETYQRVLLHRGRARVRENLAAQLVAA